MKATPTILTALTISLFGVVPAWGADKFLGDGGDNGREHLLAQMPVAMMPVNRTAALFGSPAPDALASRAIVLTPGMKSVTVASGETVAFKAGNRTVGWTFLEAIGGRSIEMNVIFPDLPEAKGVWIHIERSKLFTGG
ncbi:CzcE family metal-binding protein [Cupriavidus sp. Agwp_2]|uniref:CzcE family metal-binding protein n=1 Tax=Cupriavidus sp. Agwp_2 TaxID=2897324 RepID=UPI00346058CD